MNKEEILSAVREMAKKNEKYANLVNQLEYDDASLTFLENKGFKDRRQLGRFLTKKKKD